MSSDNIEQGDDRQQQHVGNQAAEATQLSVRRKRNLVLQELSLAVGTVQCINNVLGDIDALLTAPEEEDEEDEGGDHDDAQRMAVDRGEEGPRRHVGVATAISARAPAAASSSLARAPLAADSDAATTTHPRKRARDATADDTRKLPGSQARSILVKQRLLLEELKRWNDS
jgi:hypothetical protein